MTNPKIIELEKTKMEDITDPFLRKVKEVRAFRRSEMEARKISDKVAVQELLYLDRKPKGK